MQTFPSTALVAPPSGRILGGWSIAAIVGTLPSSVAVTLTRDDGASLQVVVTPRGTRRAFARTAVGDVYYRRFSGITDEEAVATTRGFADLLEHGALPLQAWFPHLAMEAKPGADEPAARRRFAELIGVTPRALLDDGGRSEEPLPEARRELYFDPPGIAEFLAPEMAVDGAAVAGHVLRAIYLPPFGRRQALDFKSYVLEFERADDEPQAPAAGSPTGAPTGSIVRLQLAAGGQDKAMFGQYGELFLGVQSFDGDPDALPPQLVALCSWVMAVIRLKYDPELRLRVPSGTGEVRALSVPAHRGQGGQVAPAADGAQRGGAAEVPHFSSPSFNLTLDTECGQSCAFCSVKSYLPPHDGGDAELEQVRLQLRVARDKGVREVRLNGIDPLTFSRIFQVLDAVRECGFPKLHVFSPCRRLADASFRREFLRRSPGELVVSVPVYGVSAEVHDAVTGTPGSHAEVMRALDGLLADMNDLKVGGRVKLSSVLVRQNVHEFSAIAALARKHHLDLDAHVPYPMRQTTRDPYADSVLRERELVERFVPTLTGVEDRAFAMRTFGGAIPHPCVLLRAEQRTRLPLFGAREVQGRPPLPGTEYRSAEFVHGGTAKTEASAFAVATVPCPHVDRCALSPVCPGEHYAVYGELFGLDEFSPVEVGELYRHAPAAFASPRPPSRPARDDL